MEILISNGILDRKRKLIITEHLIEYDNGIQFGDEYAKMLVRDIAAIRYGYENIIFYKFRIGLGYKLELKDHNGSNLLIRFRSYLFQNSKSWQSYLAILDKLWLLLIEQKVRDLIEEWQNGKIVTIGNVEVTAEGVRLVKYKQLIFWESCYVKESHHYFSINSKEDATLYTTIYYANEWNGVVLFSMLSMIMNDKINNKIGT